MSGDNFDAELDQLINSSAARRNALKKGEEIVATEVQQFHEAWNEHLNTVVEPALREIAARLQASGIQAQVQRVPAHDRMGAIIQTTNAIAFYASESEARLAAYGVRRGTSLSFVPMGTTIGVVYPPHNNEMLELSKISREFVRQTALAFLKESLK